MAAESRGFPRASVIEGVRFTAQVGVPNVLQGLFKKRELPTKVAGAARAFARAYGDEDAGALSALLTPGVERVSPGDEQRGRAAVLAEYRRQFAADEIQGYRLDGLQVTAGRAGRASGRYVVARKGRPAITGRVALGMERLSGHARIRLIATEPRS